MLLLSALHIFQAIALADCTLKMTGPIQIDRDHQVVQNLKITAQGVPAIEVNGFSDVVIRNVVIEHQGAPGIDFHKAARLRIENVSIKQTGAPEAGANSTPEAINIKGESSPDLTIKNVRLEKGASGIYLIHSPKANLSQVEGHDFRGPFPRGQCVQFDHSDEGRLENFACENDARSWPEDVVSAWRSSNVAIRHGLIDGNNSPAGVAVMIEQDDPMSRGGVVEDVDAIHQANGCFSAYPARDVSFVRTRCAASICTDQGRGKPRSGGLGWTAEPKGSSNIKVSESSYQDLCGRKVFWDEKVFAKTDAKKTVFSASPPFRAQFCWPDYPPSMPKK